MAENNIKALFADTHNFEQRYKTILDTFNAEPQMVAALVALTCGIKGGKHGRSLEQEAFEVTRVLLALLVWLEFGPRKASEFVPLLCEIFNNSEAVFFLKAVDAEDVPQDIKDKVPGHKIIAEATVDLSGGDPGAEPVLERFPIKDAKTGEINRRALSSYAHFCMIEIMERSGIPPAEVVAVLGATIKHLTLVHVDDKVEGEKMRMHAAASIVDVHPLDSDHPDHSHHTKH